MLYSELSSADANATVENGELKYNLGNLLIFMFKASKLIDLCEDLDKMNSLYHRAFKKVSYWQDGQLVVPDKPNAYKFELFLQNALPFCGEGRLGVIKVNREDEFAPVKNATGVDSPESAREFIYKQGTRWLTRAGKALAEGHSGEVEVDTMLSYEGEGLEKVETPVTANHIK